MLGNLLIFALLVFGLRRMWRVVAVEEAFPDRESYRYWITPRLLDRFPIRFGANCILRNDCIERGSAWFAQPPPNRSDELRLLA